MQIQLGRVSEFISDYLYSQKDPDPTDLLAELSEISEISSATYFANPRNDREMVDHVPLSASTYRMDWQARYIEQDYHLVDPCVQMGMRSVLPLDWAILPKDQSPLQRQFFGESSDLGIGDLGLTIPVRDPNGGRGLFSLALDVKRHHWDMFRKEHIADLNYAGFLFHDFMLRRNGYLTTMGLTARELEVLHWTANGKTKWETAQILGISVNTVRMSHANVRAKLSAANITQAVAICVQKGLIHV